MPPSAVICTTWQRSISITFNDRSEGLHMNHKTHMDREENQPSSISLCSSWFRSSWFKSSRLRSPVSPSWFLVFMVAATGFTVRAEDWPAFRGPGGQGQSSERDVPLEWSESRNVVWKSQIPGLGWSSPVVAKGRVWLTTAVKDRGASLRAIAFDVETGREIVNAEVFRVASATPLNPKNSLASPTPIVDGDRLYVHFGS